MTVKCWIYLEEFYMQRTEGEKRKVLLIDAKDLVELVCSRHMTDGLGVKKKKK